MVSFRSVLAASLLLAATVSASPIAREGYSLDPANSIKTRQSGCTEILKRRAWQDLSNEEKTAYLDAEVCLMNLPSKSGLEAAVTRFDDLIKAHQIQARVVHNDGWFLPFHRLHMHAHEKLLREECGYKGAQPYWDEERDAGRFSTSSVFDPVYGFGGDGVGPNNCIATGRFANYTLHTGPGYENTEHCIDRNIDDAISLLTGSSYVNECLALPDYATAWQCMAGSPHAGGHNAVGGEMSNPISSPGDPLFYLHHTFLDRVWWRWQAAGLPRRLTDIAGYTDSVEPPTGWVEAKLSDELVMYGIIPNAKIADIMDIGGGLLCHEYV